jgi:pimeloyl-ACP methyl ester carboxylesterase
VRLITYDRPGYGGSDRKEGRRVADAADDVAAIAEQLGIERFSVVGRSGGGPHALACAALLGRRVTRTAVLVSVAPANAAELDWFDGMTDDNVESYKVADTDERVLIERLVERREEIMRDPESLVVMLHDSMNDSDRRLVGDVTMRRLLASTYEEALRTGPYGWIDDVFALRKDWGFDLGAINTPVLLWHGAEDRFSPATHTRWLARQIPNAQVEVQVQDGAAHFGAVAILPDLLNWLVARPVVSA